MIFQMKLELQGTRATGYFSIQPVYIKYRKEIIG